MNTSSDRGQWFIVHLSHHSVLLALKERRIVRVSRRYQAPEDLAPDICTQQSRKRLPVMCPMKTSPAPPWRSLVSRTVALSIRAETMLRGGHISLLRAMHYSLASLDILWTL